MADYNNHDSGMPTDEAINKVLTAEQNAQQSIVECRQQALGILQSARQKAHRISEHTDERITRIHQRCSRLVTDEINALQGVARQQMHERKSFNVNDETINRVAEKLARLLTVG